MTRCTTWREYFTFDICSQPLLIFSEIRVMSKDFKRNLQFSRHRSYFRQNIIYLSCERMCNRVSTRSCTGSYVANLMPAKLIWPKPNYVTLRLKIWAASWEIPSSKTKLYNHIWLEDSNFGFIAVGHGRPLINYLCKYHINFTLSPTGSALLHIDLS